MTYRRMCAAGNTIWLVPHGSQGTGPDVPPWLCPAHWRALMDGWTPRVGTQVVTHYGSGRPLLVLELGEGEAMVRPMGFPDEPGRLVPVGGLVPYSEAYGRIYRVRRCGR